MILAAAVCPHPPMLVPEIATGAAADLAGVRAACDDVIQRLLLTEPDRLVVIGSGPSADDRDEGSGGTFARFGVNVRAGGAHDDLPLSLTMGAWLLDRAGWTGSRTYSTGIPATEGRVALLVMADGSAKRSTTAPGFLDDRSEAFDATIGSALRTGDSAALAALDEELAADLWAAGVPALKSLGEMTKDADISANLRVDAAPLGVGYWVADWIMN